MAERVTTMIPKHTCPSCGHRMDRTEEVYGTARPKPGDVSLCIRCGEAMIFDHDLSHRAPTEQERIEINRSPTLRDAREIIRGEYAAYQKAGGDRRWGSFKKWWETVSALNGRTLPDEHDPNGGER